MNYNYVLLSEYDKRLKIRKQDFLGFSKKALKKHYKGKNYSIIGEIKKEKPNNDSNLFTIVNEQYAVKQYGSHGALFNRKSGFVCAGGDNYIAVLKSRIPFLILLLGFLAGIGVGIALLINMLTGNDVPVLAPDHPLPDVDPSIEEIVDDNDTPNSNINEGGGSVSMIYSLKADINLTKNTVNILFKNPSKSNHDVALELYVTKGTESVVISRSGRIPAGHMVRILNLIPDSAVLSEGVYEGFYKVIYYNPQTGERALVESDITDVEITVKK